MGLLQRIEQMCPQKFPDLSSTEEILCPDGYRRRSPVQPYYTPPGYMRRRSLRWTLTALAVFAAALAGYGLFSGGLLRF